MALEDHITKSERELLKQIRKEYTREDCINMWEKSKGNLIKKVPGGFWENRNHRAYVIEEFVRQYQREHPGEYPIAKEFYSNRLSGVLRYYKSSPMHAFADAGFTDKESDIYDPILAETPWLVLTQPPLGYWREQANVKKAVDWLAKKTNKEVAALESSDFTDNKLAGLLREVYKGSPIAVIRAAGYDLRDLDRGIVPQNYWKNKDNRVKALREFADNIQKPAEAITQKDFKNGRLAGLLAAYHYTGKKQADALREAGLLPEAAGTA